ncbi:hypothetical protein OROMI_017515 [Orobanche minor]
MIQIARPTRQEFRVRLAFEHFPNSCYFCRVIGHLVKDCSECLDIAQPLGEMPEDKLAYGDWLRTHDGAQQSKVVKGSLNRSVTQPQYSNFSGQCSNVQLRDEDLVQTVSESSVIL